jgi:hypothetical protein
MSHTYSTDTFSLAPQSVPASFDSAEAFDVFYHNLPSADNSNMLRSVRGSTRDGWAIYLLQHVLERMDFTRLQFLTGKIHRYNFEHEYGSFSRISVIYPAELADTIADLEQLLVMLKDNADVVYDADEVGVFSDGEVEVASERDYVSANPAYDPNVAGEDGQSADYLFVLLRSILMVLKNAQQAGFVVLHLLRI